MKLAISEIYGPVFQGEGPTIGEPACFLRTGGCNLHCVWCDTPYTWRWTDQFPNQSNTVYDPKVEVKMKTAHEVAVALWVAGLSAKTILIATGGEPMLQQKGLVEVFDQVECKHIEIETAGTMAPIPELTRRTDIRYNVSLKFDNSGNSVERRERPHAIEALRDTGQVQAWKFVAIEPDDLRKMSDLVERYKLAPIYVMPEGTVAGAVNGHAQDLAADVLKLGWNLTTRLQVLLYGDRRAI